MQSRTRPDRASARRGALSLLAAAMAGLAAAPGAGAATGAPTVTTGGARAVSFGSATLTGSVNPRGANTSYYFQYGPTRAYGGQSAIADAGAGTGTVGVRVAIAGLQPLTVYHYRLVAVNVHGASIGSDRTLLTTKVPLSLQILASPNPVPYGGAAVVQGTLSGTNNANRTVVLQGNQWPFTGGFQNVGNPELTNASGGFSFTLLGMQLITQFRVVTTTNPPVVSPVALENVAVRVSSHVARTRRRGFARIYGTVTPAEDGMQVGMLRIVRGRGVLVGGTVLRHRSPSISTFSRVVRVHRGIYRVLVRVTSAGQVSSYGQALLIG